MDKNIEKYIKQIVNDLNCSQKEKDEIAEEIDLHLNLLRLEYIEKGFSEEEATQKTIISFGNEKQLKKGFQSSLFPLYKIFKYGIFGISGLYFLVLFSNLLFIRFYHNYFIFGDAYTKDILHLTSWKFNANLIPFKSILNYLINFDNFNLNIILHNTLGNILIFIPFGFLLPILWSKYNTLSRVIFSTILITLTIETLQILFSIGIFDIDDVILNTIGSIIGYYIISYTIVDSKYRWSKYLKPSN